jgi:hypothetical protein
VGECTPLQTFQTNIYVSKALTTLNLNIKRPKIAFPCLGSIPTGCEGAVFCGMPAGGANTQEYILVRSLGGPAFEPFDFQFGIFELSLNFNHFQLSSNDRLFKGLQVANLIVQLLLGAVKSLYRFP